MMEGPRFFVVVNWDRGLVSSYRITAVSMDQAQAWAGYRFSGEPIACVEAEAGWEEAEDRAFAEASGYLSSIGITRYSIQR